MTIPKTILIFYLLIFWSDWVSAEKPPLPNADQTLLGGTVPALWEIERPATEKNGEYLSVLPEQNRIAPPVSGKVIRYVTRLMQHYDGNADNMLQEDEWKKMPCAPQAMDIDGDRNITLEEMLRFTAIYGQDRTIHRPIPVDRYFQPQMISAQFLLFKPVSPPPLDVQPQKQDKSDVIGQTNPAEKDLTEKTMEKDEIPIDDATYEEIAANRQVSVLKKYNAAPETLRGVPAWFLLRDQNGDAQVSLKEFAPMLSAPALALFGRFDLNGDGFITPDEIRTPSPAPSPAPSSPPSNSP
jgi:hypothetical protein